MIVKSIEKQNKVAGQTLSRPRKSFIEK